MNKESVYKLDSKSKERIWSIWVTEAENSATIHIEAGLLDGEKITNETIITEGKNIGKANETDPYTQAVLQARAKLELKLRGEYVRDLSSATKGVLRSGIPAPMLAQKYHPTGAQSSSKTLVQMGILGDTIDVQPKYDGNRCLISVKPTADLTDLDAVMYTRKGDVMPVQLTHILDEVKNNYGHIFCAEGYIESNPEIILDGELFSSELSFNELNGHLKRKSSQDSEQLAKIQYHLYDEILDEPYTTRYRRMMRFNSDNVILIPSHTIVASDEAINEKLEQFLAEGHEGLMIRTLNTGYESKRTWQLVKCKIFEDSEFKILDLEADSMGRLGNFLMEMDTPTIDRDGVPVTTFKAGLTGVSHEEGIKMLQNKSDYIGKMATVQYFGRDFRPRFPKYKGLRV